MNGVDSETRTHGIQGHNLALYQLSHIHHMVRLAGVEPTTYALEGRCSILLRYRRIHTRMCNWSERWESDPRNQLGRLALYH